MDAKVERRVRALAARQASVVSRRQLYALGVHRGEVRAQVRARRWQRVGTQGVALFTGPLPDEARWWAAVFEGGPRAFLDGASALIASGLQRFEQMPIRVSVPKGARVRRRRNGWVDIRETRRFQNDDVLAKGVPRAQPAIAAVRGALWARTDREAMLLVTMAVQQQLCTVENLARELRRTPNGSYYLDFRWHRYGVVVEVDGIQHAWAEQLVGDSIRHNTIAIAGDIVLRLPVMGLRLCPDDFFAQVAQALRSRGWASAAA